MRAVFVAMLFLPLGCVPEPAAVRSEVFFVEHEGVSVEVRVEHSRLARRKSRTLVLLPSATYSVQPNWDLSFNELSVMRAFAELGWTVLAIDLPGYGSSDDPPHPARFGAVDAVAWVDAVVRHWCRSHATETVDILGWSWGAQVAGRYAAEFPERVRSVVLYGFTYRRRLPRSVLPDGEFRRLEFESAMSDFVPGCSSAGVPEAYARACLDADELVPSGALRDYVLELPIVDPAALRVPVMVLSGQFEVEQHQSVGGDHGDFFASRLRDLEEFCERLPGPATRPVILPGGGHAIHFERVDEWRAAVLQFLERH